MSLGVSPAAEAEASEDVADVGGEADFADEIANLTAIRRRELTQAIEAAGAILDDPSLRQSTD